MQLKRRAELDKALQQNPPNYLTALPARCKMHCQLRQPALSLQPNTSCIAASPSAPCCPPNLGVVWWSPACSLPAPCVRLSILSCPPSGACALDAVSMVTAAPGLWEEQLDAGAGRTGISLWISQKLDRDRCVAEQDKERRGEGTR